MEVKKNSVRASILLGLMGIMSLLLLVTLITSIKWYLTLAKMSADDSYYMSYYLNNPYVLYFQASVIFYYLSVLLTGISFLFWFQRVYRNLIRLGIEHLTYKPYMAWLSWFIPIVSLFIPYKIMKEVWDETENLNRSEADKYHKETSYTLVNLWWIAYLVMVVCNFFADKIIGAGSFTDLQNGVLLFLTGSVFGLISLGCLFQIIIKIKKQENNYYLAHQFDGLVDDDEI